MFSGIDPVQILEVITIVLFLGMLATLADDARIRMLKKWLSKQTYKHNEKSDVPKGREKYIKQLDEMLKNGLIDKDEYLRLLQRRTEYD